MGLALPGSYSDNPTSVHGDRCFPHFHFIETYPQRGTFPNSHTTGEQGNDENSDFVWVQ